MKAVTGGVATYNSLLRTRINDYLREQLKEYGYSDLMPSHVWRSYDMLAAGKPTTG